MHGSASAPTSTDFADGGLNRLTTFARRVLCLGGDREQRLPVLDHRIAQTSPLEALLAGIAEAFGELREGADL